MIVEVSKPERCSGHLVDKNWHLKCVSVSAFFEKQCIEKWTEKCLRIDNLKGRKK